MELFGHANLIRPYFRENQKIILINILGLMIVTLIFTVAFISDLTFKMSYVENEVSKKGQYNFCITNDSTETDNPDSLFLRFEANKIRNMVNSTAKRTNVADFVSDTYYYSLGRNVDLNDTSTGENYWPDPFFQSVNRTILSEMAESSQFVGRLPEQSNEIIYLAASSYFSNKPSLLDDMKELMEVGEEIYISIEGTQVNFTFILVGVYTPSLNEKIGISDPLLINHPILLPHGLLIDHQFFQILFSPLAREAINWHVRVEFSLSIKEQADYFTIGGILSDIKRFSTSISVHQGYYENRYIPSGDHYLYVQSLGMSEFDLLTNELTAISLMGFITLIPSLIIAFFLAQYVFNVFEKHWEHQIGLMRLRGATSNQIFYLVLIEGVISFVCALIIGYFVCIGFFGVILSFMPFFSPNFIFEKVLFSNSTIQSILIWSGLITSYFVFKRERKAIKLDIKDTVRENLAISTESQSKRGLLLFFVGITGSFFYFNISTFTGTNETFLDLFFILIALLFIPFPIFILVGGILSISYIVIPVLNRTAKLTWNKFGNLFSYSLTNLVRQGETIRVILIVSITFSMFWLMFTLPAVLHANTVRNSYYSTGADSYYSHAWNSTLEKSFLDDPSIEQFSPVAKIRFQISEYFYLTSGIISPNYLEAAYFEESFISKTTLENFINTSPTTSYFPILMSIMGLEYFGLKISDTIFLGAEGGVARNFTIVGTYTYWPRLVYSEHFDSSGVVMTNATYNQLKNVNFFGSSSEMSAGYYFKLAFGANRSMMKDAYGEESLIFAEELISESESAGAFQILRVNLIILFFLNCITIFLIIFFNGYFQLSNRIRELAVERALGMKLPQLTRSFLYESASILVFSLIFGSIFGILLSFSIILIWLVVLPPSSFLPPIVFFPLLEISLSIGLFIFIGLLACVIPARFARKKNLSVALRTF